MHTGDERAGAVERSGEDLVARCLGGRQRFAGDGGLVDVAGSLDDDRVGADVFARADPDQIADVQAGRVDPGLVVAGAEAGGTFGGDVEQSPYGIGGPGGREGLECARGREDDDLPDFRMPDEEQVHLAAEGFRLLADPTRIKILWALLQGETSVACLAELVGAAPTAVSRHLAKLRLAGLVRGRREGTFVHYSAADPHVRALLSEALFHAEQATSEK